MTRSFRSCSRPSTPSACSSRPRSRSRSPRNPMTLAQTAYDLQLASHGRFRLGLGTQIKPHIEKRFSMPWSQPVERMRELVLAIRAIWATWHEGAPLDFRGEFYRHTLMTPFFNPGPSPYGLPSIFLAGVGPRMTEMAGEVADGFIVHPFGTERSLRELTIPAIERGAARAGRALSRHRGRVPADGRGRRHRRGARARSRRDAPPPRVLRIDARVQGHPRRARLGRSPARAQPALEDRRLGCDERAHHRRDGRRVQRAGHPRHDRRDRARALRRSRATDLVRHERASSTADRAAVAVHRRHSAR